MPSHTMILRYCSDRSGNRNNRASAHRRGESGPASQTGPKRQVQGGTVTSAGGANYRPRKTLPTAWIRPKHQSREYGHSPSLARTCVLPGQPPISRVETRKRRFLHCSPVLVPRPSSFSASIHVYQTILCLTVAFAQQRATKKRPDRSRDIEISFSRKLLHFRDAATVGARAAVNTR
jgi:hypothetical protein